MLPSLTSAPAAEPLSLTQAKAHLRVETTDDDALITTLIAAARMWCEGITGTRYITQTWRVPIDWDELEDLYEEEGIELPLRPIQSVTVKYYNSSGVLSTLSSSDYWLDTYGESGRVRLKASATSPTYEDDRPTPMHIDVVCGYGATSASIPSGELDLLQSAMKLKIGDLYAHREELALGASFSSPAELSAKRLLGLLRLGRAAGAGA